MKQWEWDIIEILYIDFIIALTKMQSNVDMVLFEFDSQNYWSDLVLI